MLSASCIDLALTSKWRSPLLVMKNVSVFPVDFALNHTGLAYGWSVGLQFVELSLYAGLISIYSKPVHRTNYQRAFSSEWNYVRILLWLEIPVIARGWFRSNSFDWPTNLYKVVFILNQCIHGSFSLSMWRLDEWRVWNWC